MDIADCYLVYMIFVINGFILLTLIDIRKILKEKF